MPIIRSIYFYSSVALGCWYSIADPDVQIGRRVRGNFMELKCFEEDVLGAVFIHMVPLQFVEGSLIYKKGDVADGLFLVQDGEATVVSQKLLHQEFASLDVNQDGTLTVEEFLGSEYAKGLKESALQRFLQRYDPERTGVLGLKDQNDVVNISTHVVAGHMFGFVGVFPDLARLRLDQVPPPLPLSLLIDNPSLPSI